MHTSTKNNHEKLCIKKLIAKSYLSAELNSEILNQLIDDTDEVTCLRILARFHETLLENKKLLLAAITDQDRKLIWNICHKIGSTAQLLGFIPLSKLTQKVGANINDGDFNSDDLINTLGLLINTMTDATQLIIESCPSIKDHLY